MAAEPTKLTYMERHLAGIIDHGLPGPLLLIFGGMHGNEPAGVKALQELLLLLNREAELSSSFRLRGRLLGIRGNCGALQTGVRFVREDLNRMWTPDRIAAVRSLATGSLQDEELELRELADLIDREVVTYRPGRFVVFDLHTTSANGGIFCMANDEDQAEALAGELHAPVIRGFLTGLGGTTLHYFNDRHFPYPTRALSFEAGQHHDPLSADRALAACINLLGGLGMIPAARHRNDKLLLDHSRHLPKLSELVYTHHIREEDQFRMRPGFANFDPVEAGQILADDRRGPVAAPQSGRILMPLYQGRGRDGFFIIREV